MVTLYEVIAFVVSMKIRISSLQTNNVNRCGRSRHLARTISLRRKLIILNVFEIASTFFFFSSRRRHTRFSRDWSSDACSSDLLMDEPLSNLDAQLRLQTRTELKRLHRELGTTMIYVTHDQGEAMTLGSRIAILRNGLLVQVGTPLELYRQPADTFVATLLRSPPMNLIEVARNGSRAFVGVRPV